MAGVDDGIDEGQAGARWLGWSGVLPFAGLAALAWWPGEVGELALRGFAGYSVVILSFLGGVRWGRALAARAGAAEYARAVLPSLVGWVALALPVASALPLLAAAFALAWWSDGPGDAMAAPAWFRRLRAGLSASVISAHALAWPAALIDAPVRWLGGG